jgi:hypothetical protein
MPGRVELIERDSTPWELVLAGVWFGRLRERAGDLDGRLPGNRRRDAGGGELDPTRS